MHLPTIFAALLLPLAAVAEEMTTTTATSYLTLTRTITLQRAQMTGVSNSTGLPPTASTTLTPPGSTTTQPPADTTGNAGSTLGGAHVAAAAVAGVVVAVFL
ncbi:hypothetical protein MFIFM68171_02717 [Madurella fahalii]|uniref:Uncharacterized protein n=1 Tax=Madurella fahalii TaxID=1157608 RepID=A0ABQ0G443_9PEZI